MNTTNYARLRDAYSIIDGVPDQKLNLNFWSATGEPVNPHSCGTVGCAAGLLSVHPLMRKHGLRATRGGAPKFAGRDEFSALAHFFGTSYDEAHDLFSWRGSSDWDYIQDAMDRFPTDKQLWLYRVRFFLRRKGEHVAVEEPSA